MGQSRSSFANSNQRVCRQSATVPKHCDIELFPRRCLSKKPHLQPRRAKGAGPWRALDRQPGPKPESVDRSGCWMTFPGRSLGGGTDACVGRLSRQPKPMGEVRLCVRWALSRRPKPMRGHRPACVVRSVRRPKPMNGHHSRVSGALPPAEADEWAPVARVRPYFPTEAGQRTRSASPGVTIRRS